MDKESSEMNFGCFFFSLDVMDKISIITGHLRTILCLTGSSDLTQDKSKKDLPIYLFCFKGSTHTWSMLEKNENFTKFHM